VTASRFVAESCHCSYDAAAFVIFFVNIIIAQAHLRGVQANLDEDAKCVPPPPPPPPPARLTSFHRFVVRLHDARSRDAAAAAAAAAGKSKDRFASARAMSLRRLKVSRPFVLWVGREGGGGGGSALVLDARACCAASVLFLL
jgi:hypothetical protein